MRKQKEHKPLDQKKNLQEQDLLLHTAPPQGSLLTVSRKYSLIIMNMYSSLLSWVTLTNWKHLVSQGTTKVQLQTSTYREAPLDGWLGGAAQVFFCLIALKNIHSNGIIWPSHLQKSLLLWSPLQGLFNCHFYSPRTPCTHQLQSVLPNFERS